MLLLAVSTVETLNALALNVYVYAFTINYRAHRSHYFSM